MKKQTQILTVVGLALWIVAAANAQSANLITGNSAGKVKLGMTVAQVRKAVAPMKLSRTSDGEGMALIAVRKGGTDVMILYAGEDDRDSRINEKARIEQIEVWDRSYRTKEGVHSGMLLSDAEKKYGKVNSITLSQIESREYAEFANNPDGLHFRLLGKNGSAGAYVPNEYEATAYTDGTIIDRIEVRRPRGTSDIGSVRFSSSYTDLKTGCKTSGGIEGGHVSTFCKGPEGYQIHYFDSATTLEFNAENEVEDFQVRLGSEALDYVSRNSKVEWRHADGKPFAVIMRIFKYPVGGEFPKQGKPVGSFLVVKGLKGFESIDGRIDGKEMYPNMQTRELADAAFKAKKPSGS